MNKRALIIICLVLLAPMRFTAATEKPSRKQKQDISITILYDNYVFTEGLRSDWGFSCILKGTEKTILFDTCPYHKLYTRMKIENRHCFWAGARSNSDGRC